MVTNGVRHIVPLERIVSGGVPKDGIPSIDRPKFVSAEEADKFLSDKDLVFGIHYNGEARAYPAMILVWHEIVNDWIGGKPVLVTYCPLCHSTIAFERLIDGQPVEFGVSGKLYNSDLVMYDRKTDTYWSQILGKAIVGELAGRELKPIPMDHTQWGLWKRFYPATKVLSKETGHIRPYGADPYGDYYTSNIIVFPVESMDSRLHPKTIIFGLMVGAEQKAYPRESVLRQGAINDRISGLDVLVVGATNGSVRAFERRVGNDVLEFVVEDGKILDTKTKSIWNIDGFAISGQYVGAGMRRLPGMTSFWFAWAAFYPGTGLYQ